MRDCGQGRPATKVEKVGSTLQRIAAMYKPESDEYRAIEKAAHAFLFHTSHERLRMAYEEYRKHCGKPLSRSQRAVLHGFGIEP